MSHKLPKCVMLQVSCEGRSAVIGWAPSCQVSGTLCRSSTGPVQQTEREGTAAVDGHTSTTQSLLMRTVGSYIPQSTMTSHPVVGDIFMYAWQLAASWSCIGYLLCRIIHSSEASCVCLQHAQIATLPEDSLEPRPAVHCTLYPWLPAPTDNQSTVHALE